MAINALQRYAYCTFMKSFLMYFSGVTICLSICYKSIALLTQFRKWALVKNNAN